MSLSDFCKSLQQCAEKLEQDIKYNINDAHNLFFGKAMDEPRLSVEKAKDFHYGEMVNALNQILINVKLLRLHQDKIEWLTNDVFSYGKSQVQAGQKPAISKSVENIATPHITMRERRRTVSAVSAKTLVSWEKYLDQLEKNEKVVLENTIETKNAIPRRTLSNARTRKKFVSSTMGAFLDDNGGLCTGLESINEKPQNEQNADCNTPDSIPAEEVEKELTCALDGRNDDADPCLAQSQTTDEYSVINCDIKDAPLKCIQTKVGISDTLDLVDRITENIIKEEDVISEFMKDFEACTRKEIGPMQEDPIKIKPKIVDVIYKKKPSY